MFDSIAFRVMGLKTLHHFLFAHVVLFGASERVVDVFDEGVPLGATVVRTLKLPGP